MNVRVPHILAVMLMHIKCDFVIKSLLNISEEEVRVVRSAVYMCQCHRLLTNELTKHTTVN